MKKLFSLCLIAFPMIFGWAQNKKDILMYVNEQPIYAQEFKRVYKKNLDLVQDESQKDVDSYLELFIDYKLKVAEAKTQGLDQEESYLKELAQYRDQLSRNYLFEDKIIEDLVKEAYERGKYDIEASHILVMVGPDAPPADTLTAYNKIKEVHEKAIKGTDFESLARQYSEEPNAKGTSGYLGYFSVFSMVYPFETAAYNTPEGEISDIVRTRFGYHIIKVHDRREKLNRIQVSHIMISDKKGDRNFNAEERAKEIAAMIKQGKNFEDLAREFSDDKPSAVEGGRLNPFAKGELRAPEFEDAAYKLTEKGQISDPVKTDFGWHIIRLDEKLPEETFESQQEVLEKRVMQGDRSKVVSFTVTKKIKDKYGFQSGEPFMPFFQTYVPDTAIARRKWVMEPIAEKDDKFLFRIGDKSYKFSDFAKFLEVKQKTMRPYPSKEAILSNLYDEFEIETVKDYFKEKLEKENPDYAAILNEYRDGLLIFDVMDRNIWTKAQQDTLGLQTYFEKIKHNYQWNERVEGTIFSATSKEQAQRVKNMLEEGKTPEEIRKTLNEGETVNVILSNGAFEATHPTLPKNFEFKKGISDIYTTENGSYTVVLVNEVLPESPKTLDDVRGIVISQYQQQLEKEWLDYLHQNYDVKVRKRMLRKLRREL